MNLFKRLFRRKEIVVPPDLMAKLRLADGLISAGNVYAAQAQLRAAIILYGKDTTPTWPPR